MKKKCIDCEGVVKDKKTLRCYVCNLIDIKKNTISRKLPAALEIDDQMPMRIQDLDRDIVEQFKATECCRLPCNLTFSGKERIMYVLCSNGEVRWWHMFPSNCKKV